MSNTFTWKKHLKIVQGTLSKYSWRCLGELAILCRYLLNLDKCGASLKIKFTRVVMVDKINLLTTDNKTTNISLFISYMYIYELIAK